MPSDLDLAPKALVADGGGEIFVEYFDRDGPIVSDVARAVDGGHPTAPDLALDFISRCELLSQFSFVHQPISAVGGSPILGDSKWFRKSPAGNRELSVKEVSNGIEFES